MKTKFILLALATIVVASSAFTPTTGDKPEMKDVKISYSKITDVGVKEVTEIHTVKATESKQFVQDWYKQHGMKAVTFCSCTVRFDEDACICIETCCAWGGVELGVVCVSQTISCVGTPQSLCD